VRGGGNELAHKWFDNGSWSRGWQYLGLGGTMAANPSVGSWLPGHLDVFAADPNHNLVDIWTYQGIWSDWQMVGDVAPDSLSVTTSGYQNWEMFVRGTDGALWRRSVNYHYSAGWESLGGFINSAPAATVWNVVEGIILPPPPTPTPSPAPTPTPPANPCGRSGECCEFARDGSCLVCAPIHGSCP
jgi:hypothetical protein